MLGEEGLQTLCRVILDSVQQYLVSYTSTSYLHSSRTRSSATNDHLVENGKRLLPQIGFKHLRVGQRNLFAFGDEFLIHLKKLSPNFRPSNFPTQTALKLFDEGTSDALPGIAPSLPILTAGYVPNAYFTDILGVYMTYIQRGATQWVARLDREAEELTEPNIVPILPYDPSSPIAATRIRPKPDAERRDIFGDASGRQAGGVG